MVHFMLMHVTVLLIVAFFVLFAASKAEGIVRLFGYLLGAWLMLGAVLHVVGFFMPGTLGMKPGMHGGMMHDHWMHHWGQTEQPAPAKPAPAPAAAPPATPAPKKP